VVSVNSSEVFLVIVVG